MKADALPILFDLETPLEKGVQTAFDNMALTAYNELNGYSVFEKRRPRIEVTAKVGAANGHVFISQTTGAEQLDQWRVTLDFSAIVDPDNAEANNTMLPQLTAAIRQFAGQLAQQSRADQTTFPYHCFSDRLSDAGTEYYITPEKGVTWRKLTYTATWGIRSNAWPDGF